MGAGIVGMTVAQQLSQSGLRVHVLEARKIGGQVTGRSTAKITTQHSLIYSHLIKAVGLEHARDYAEANREAAFWIRRRIGEIGIRCDFEPKDAYAYTCNPSLVPAIEAEAHAARSLGLVANVVKRAPLPFKTFSALHFPDQAQFNPVKYLVGLARSSRAAGVRIFEGTRVDELVKKKRWHIHVGRTALQAEHVVLATHLPIAGSRPFDQMTQPRCHIAMAFGLKPSDAIEGMFIGIDEPTHSLRMGRDRKGPLLVALGPRFNTGHDRNVAARFRDLEVWVRRNLPVREARWRWVNEDYDTADRLPFAGPPTKRPQGLYIAAGFNGWGITNGTAAGVLIADQILGRANPFAALFDASRKASTSFNKGGESKSRVRTIRDIGPGEGGIVKRGKRDIAVWRSRGGELRAFSAACTHKGCPLTWNNADRTWDCPCHGSIFSASGEVIHGPAVEPLEPCPLPEQG